MAPAIPPMSSNPLMKMVSYEEEASEEDSPRSAPKWSLRSSATIPQKRKAAAATMRLRLPFTHHVRAEVAPNVPKEMITTMGLLMSLSTPLCCSPPALTTTTTAKRSSAAAAAAAFLVPSRARPTATMLPATRSCRQRERKLQRQRLSRLRSAIPSPPWQ